MGLPTVQRFSGHKTFSMVARYAHQSGLHIEAAKDWLKGPVSGVQEDNIHKLKTKKSWLDITRIMRALERIGSCVRQVVDSSGARGRNRTTDTRIFSPLLYP